MIIARYQAEPGKAYPEALPRVDRIIETGTILASVLFFAVVFPNFQVYLVTRERLVTGQNPASAGVGERMLGFMENIAVSRFEIGDLRFEIYSTDESGSLNKSVKF